MADIIIVNGGYKPTYNWGAPPWMWPIFNHHHRQGPRIYWTAAPKKRCGLDELMSCGILECLTGLTFRSFRQPGPGMTWLSASESCQAAYAMPPLLCGWFMPYLCHCVGWFYHWSITGPYWPSLIDLWATTETDDTASLHTVSPCITWIHRVLGLAPAGLIH